jgi:hypothetical protein
MSSDLDLKSLSDSAQGSILDLPDMFLISVFKRFDLKSRLKFSR